MKKISKYILSITFSLFALTGISVAEDANPDDKDILAICIEEAKGAIDVDIYIEECIKEKQEELKEASKETQ